MRAPVPPPAPEPRFRELIDRVGAIVYEAVPGRQPGDAHFVSISQGAETLLGYPARRWTEDPRFWLEIIHPDDRDHVRADTERALRANRPAQLEYRNVTAQGAEVWVRNVVYPDRLPDGSLRLSGVVIDVTESHRAEERLERIHLASARLSARMTQAETAQVIAELGRESVGASAVAVFVRRGDQLVPHGYDGHADVGVPEDCTIPVAADLPLAEAVRTAKPQLLGAREATERFPADGRRLLGGDGALAVLPLLAGDASPLGALAVRMAAGDLVADADRTLLEVLARTGGAALERVAALDAERAARTGAEDANALLDTLISTAPEGYALFDRELRYQRVNQALADMNGRSIEDHLGRPVTEVIPDVPIAGLLGEVRDTGRSFVDLEVDGANAAGQAYTWLVSYYPVYGSGGTVEWIGAFVVDITARKRAERRVELLAELGAILEEGGNVEDRLTRVADALTGTFAEWTTVYLRGPGDGLTRVVTRHVDPEAEARIRDNPPSGGGGGMLERPRRFDDMSEADYGALAADPVARDNHRAIGTRSVLTAPLALRGGRLGVLGVGSTVAAAFDEADERFLTDVAGRAALAIDNARLYAAERAARGRTERQYAVAAALADALTPVEVAGALLGELLPAVEADVGVVWRVTEEGTHAEMIGRRGVTRAQLSGYEHPALTDEQPLARLLGDRRARWTSDGAADGVLADLELRSTGVIPLLSAGRPVGALFLGSREPAAFGGEDHGLALTAAVQAAQALERATLFDTARRTSVTLQRSLLPRSLPAVPGVQAGLRYLPAAGLEAGGDFYEALPVGDDGALIIAVGDVVGRGATAAAAMGQLRSALRAFAQVMGEPGPVLERLSTFAEGVDGAMAATAVVASLLPATGELRYACAGHPWPLLVDAQGGATFLQEGRGVPLGCVETPPYPAASARLEPGSTLLLYTDGLTERRGTDLSAALERLRVTAGAAAHLDLDGLLDAVVTAMGDEDASDDVALVAVRMTGAPTDRHLTFPAELAQVPTARAVVRTWLAELGVTGDAAADVLLASGEAFANAVEHSGATEVRLALTSPDEGVVGVEIEDAGSWRPPRKVTSRGRGLTMMQALVDELDVDSTGSGTRVRMRHGVRQAAPAAAPAPVPGGCEVVLEGSVARLRGALDMASAATVGARLQDAARGGLLIDLSKVDFLDSTGARLLLELADTGTIRIVAPPGSPPRRTLELSGLDRVLTLVDLL